MIKRAQQFRPITGRDGVGGELPDVEVEGDEVIDLMHLARREFLSQFQTTLPPRDVFAPRLGRQGKRRGGGLVPASALTDVVNASRDVGGQRNDLAIVADHTMPHGGVQVAVGIVFQLPPERRVWLEVGSTILLRLQRRIEQVGNDRVLADVVGDVLLGVVGPHLLLVDVLLENVAQHVGVDLVPGSERSRIEMPVVLIEERKEPLEGFVGDVDVGMLALQFMHVEQAAVEIRHLTQQRDQIG